MEATRKKEVLDLIITDMHTYYLPSFTLPPLDVDENKKGVASDHRIIIFPPCQNKKGIIKREKQKFKMRPLSFQSIQDCGQFLGGYHWNEVYKCPDADGKAKKFHEILAMALEIFFPEKEVKKSPFDKKWFTPPLRKVHRQKQI